MPPAGLANVIHSATLTADHEHVAGETVTSTAPVPPLGVNAALEEDRVYEQPEGASNVKPSARTVERPSGVVTTTSTVPGGFGGVVSVRWGRSCTETRPAGTPPKVTMVPGRKSDPVTTTGVPPADVPPAGETVAIVSGLISATCHPVAEDEFASHK